MREKDRDFEDLCNIALAERALEEYGARRERLAELRWALAAKRAAAKARQEPAQHPESAGEPPPVDVLYRLAGDGDRGATRPSPFTTRG